MPDLVLGSPAIERARTVIAGEARRVPAAADAVALVPHTLGPLPAVVELLAALREAGDALTRELGVGGRRLDAVDRGLDAVLHVLQTSDAADAHSLGRM